MKRHAYLIIAHHEFPVLHRLLRLLDDERNDIYVHFDKKIASLPLLTTEKSNLYILENRIDVRWGNVSQIQAELNLFECAFHNNSSNYLYFHLISGVHIPLKSQDFIHSFFDNQYPSNVLHNMPTSEGEIDLKLRKFNLFTRYFVLPRYPKCQLFMQTLWKISIRTQKILKIKANKNDKFQKAANWVSLTQYAVKDLISKRNKILKKYKYSLCGDEFFVPSELHANSNHAIHFDENYLLTEFEAQNTKIFNEQDLDDLLSGDQLFARKFSSKNPDFLDDLVEKVLVKKIRY